MKTAALALILARTAAAAPAFDQAVDAGAALVEARARAAGMPAPPSKPSHAPEGRSWDPECRKLTFDAKSGLSLGLTLESRELIEGDCAGPDVRYGSDGRCQRPGERVRVSRGIVTIQGRHPLLPWETSTFELCLEGDAVSLRSMGKAYDYTLVESGPTEQGWEFVVAPGPRNAQPPDPDALTADFLGGPHRLVFLDKWAEHYVEGTTELRWAVKQPRGGLLPGDRTLAEGTLSGPAQARYEVALPASAVAELKVGESFVEFRFRRLAGPSKEGLTPSRRRAFDGFGR